MLEDLEKPIRYTKGKIECWDAQEAAVVGKEPWEAILIGPIIKYLWRYEDKGGIEDLYKTRIYLNRLIEKKEKQINE